MKWTIRIGIAVIISAMIAVSLSLLPRLEQSLPVLGGLWTGKKVGQLTNNNLADFLVELPLQLRIRKVALNHSILSIDLNLPRSVDEASVYRDLYTIVQSTITKSSNVNQILVRIMDYSGAVSSSTAQLVLAMEANRDKAGDLKQSISSSSAMLLEQELKARFHLTYTPKWQQRYPL
jgi:hypothetical protein